MRINKVETKKVDVTMDSDELVMIQNIMYFYENHYVDDPDCQKPNKRFHELAMQVIIAGNLCQYGHLDNFALDCIIGHQNKANSDK